MILSLRRRGFTLVELLVVIVIIGMLVGLMVPAVMRTRETARRAVCSSNIRQVGIALMNYDEANGRLPPSSAVMMYPSSGGNYVETWSAYAYLLAQLDQELLAKQLHVRANYAPWEERAGGASTNSKQVEIVRNTPIPILKCSSFTPPNDPEEVKPFTGFLGVSGSAIKGALTNYKFMGDSFRAGLKYGAESAAKRSPKAPSDVGPSHPDGAFPVTLPSSGKRQTDFSDGMSNTIFVAETIEPTYSRWLIGSECSLVGMPSSEEDSTNGVKVEQMSTTGGVYELAHYAPTGFDGNFDESSAVSSEYRTYLGYEYDKEDKYYDDKTDGEAKIKYGASSKHGDTINHMFGDWRVQPLNKSIDVALYYFLITRAGGEVYPASESARWAPVK
jgi:prepilin-type N-terminal cleavage/methylation domain-containing protein